MQNKVEKYKKKRKSVKDRFYFVGFVVSKLYACVVSYRRVSA